MASKYYKTIQLLMVLSKNQKKDEFFQLLEKTKLFSNLKNLNPQESSKLIYTFSNFEIYDKKLWTILQNLFFQKSMYMNIHDNVMCAYSFSKFNVSSEIWQEIEKSLIKNQAQFKQDQIKQPNIGLAMYSFSQNNAGSQALWDIFIQICRDSAQFFDERNIVMALYSLQKINFSDIYMWQTVFENIILQNVSSYKLLNKILIIYSYSKVDRGSNNFWAEIQSHILKIENQNFSKRDIMQLLWSFGKNGKGNDQFWERMQDLVFSYKDYNLLEFNHVAFSFYINSKGSNEFWKALFELPLQPDSDLRRKQNQFDEYLHMGKIFYFYYQKFQVQDIQTIKIWNTTKQKFVACVQDENLFMNSTVYHQHHKYFYDLCPEIIIGNRKLQENYYKKIVLLFKQGSNQFYKQLIDTIYIATSKEIQFEQDKLMQYVDFLSNNEEIITKADQKELLWVALCFQMLSYAFKSEEVHQKFDRHCAKYFDLFSQSMRTLNIISRCFSQFSKYNCFLNAGIQQTKQNLQKGQNVDDEVYFLIFITWIYRYGINIPQQQFRIIRLEFNELWNQEYQNQKKFFLNWILKNLDQDFEKIEESIQSSFVNDYLDLGYQFYKYFEKLKNFKGKARDDIININTIIQNHAEEFNALYEKINIQNNFNKYQNK